jgi:hypothetical protein
MVPKGNTNVDLVNYLTGWIRLKAELGSRKLLAPDQTFTWYFGHRLVAYYRDLIAAAIAQIVCQCCSDSRLKPV